MVGSHLLVELINAGREVKAIKRAGSDLSFVKQIFDIYSADVENDFQKIVWVDVDLMDAQQLDEALKDIDDVYHIAGMISFHKKDFHEMYSFNVGSTANMVNASLQNKIRKFCYVSSIAALGRPEDSQTVIDENLQWKASKNNSGYAISKYNAELEVWRAAAEGLDVVIVNPSVILGISDPTKSSSRMFHTIWNGLKFYPQGTNGFVDVKDVARAMIQLIQSELADERFILSGENVSYQKLFGLMAESMDKPSPTIKTSHFMGHAAWRFEKIKSLLTGKKPLLTRETARTAMNDYYYSSEKIIKSLGFEFTPLKNSLKNYGDYYGGLFRHNN